MKKKMMRDVTTCDWCGSDKSLYYTCRDCGKDACFDCRDQGATYSAGIYTSGYGDSWYCHSCDAKSSSDLHEAYRAIVAEKARLNELEKQFSATKKKLEDRAMKLFQEAEGKSR